jgi:hypothetical protein
MFSSSPHILATAYFLMALCSNVRADLQFPTALWPLLPNLNVCFLELRWWHIWSWFQVNAYVTLICKKERTVASISKTSPLFDHSNTGILDRHLWIERRCSSETSVDFQWTVQRENLKSYESGVPKPLDLWLSRFFLCLCWSLWVRSLATGPSPA